MSETRYSIKFTGDLWKPEYAQKWAREINRTLAASALDLVKEVKENISRPSSGRPYPAVNTGQLRGSVYSRLRGETVKFGAEVGVEGMAETYVLPVELGQKPHWAPIGPLILWVRRKFGGRGGVIRTTEQISLKTGKRVGLLTKGLKLKKTKGMRTEERITSMAYAVRHKIAKQGTKGHFMFMRAYERLKPEIEERFRNLADWLTRGA